MGTISVNSNPDAATLEKLGVSQWSIWEKEVSKFPWHYDEKETAYILQGEVVVTPNNGGDAVTIRAGDLVVFPAGLSCQWDVKQDLRKHYKFG